MDGFYFHVLFRDFICFECSNRLISDGRKIVTENMLLTSENSNDLNTVLSCSCRNRNSCRIIFFSSKIPNRKFYSRPNWIRSKSPDFVTVTLNVINGKIVSNTRVIQFLNIIAVVCIQNIIMFRYYIGLLRVSCYAYESN